MREILFRGKRTENGEWMYGDYCGIYRVECNDEDFLYIHLMRQSNNEFAYKVDPETVGQYTGLTDKNGKRIFEGDIIRNNGNEIGVIRRGKYDVYSRYVFGGYYCVDKTSALIEWTSCWRCEVIGNIHDNPELLEEQTNAD